VPGLAKHALVGYWHNFTNPAGPTFPLSQVSDDWNVIVVAFGDDAGNGNVSFTVDPSAGSEAQFIADVKAQRAKGKKVVLSLGGLNGSVTLNSAANVTNFVNSMYAIIQKYGFDGVDLDLESGSGVSMGAPIQTNLVSAIKQLKAKVGSSFYLSMAPEWPYVQGGYVSYGSIWGAYLPIIDGLRSELNIIHVQYYNNGGLYTPYSNGAYAEGSVDMLVGGSKMLIEGFPLSYGSAGTFAGLRPDQVAFGVPSGPSSANSGFVTSTTVKNAVDCMAKLTNCGSVKPNQAYPTFRGVMTWSINWDKHDGYNFSVPVGSYLRTLP
jgi:chitinase